MSLTRLRHAGLMAGAILLAAAAAGAQESASFPSNDADVTGGAPTMLSGQLYRAAGDGPFPAVVGMHGCGGMQRRDGAVSSIYAAWAEHLRANGFTVLLVDSFTPRQAADVCRTYLASVSPREVRPRDAYGALLYLQAQPFVHAGRVAVMGWSHGGGTMLFTVAPRMAGRPGRLPGGDFRAAVAMYPGWCRIQEHGAVWKPTLPMQVLLGADDDWTPPYPCVDMLKYARGRGAQIDLVVYPGARHGFDSLSTTPRTLEGISGAVRGRAPAVGGNAEARTNAYARVVEFLRHQLGEETR